AGQFGPGSKPEPLPPVLIGFTHTVLSTIPSGRGYHSAGSEATTVFMQSRQRIPGPRADEIPRISELSELPIQIAVSRCGTNPIARTSCRLSVVPVLRAAVRPIDVNEEKTNEPFGPVSVLSLRMLAMTQA